ncbi:HIT family protein [Acinetobacter larvae]|uniref:HIT family protein n=1 Tax=Acinetobacter larvae TaxID=1789224 RepID=A0A1B2LVJ9_9GAMM|nr:HIT family protein [Acinetobacter larvae]AOA56946.1 HIT family protein [Acinetobacter larvae]
MTDQHCPYCEYDEYDIISKNEYGVILPDVNPLSKGHSVVIPHRHVTSFFDVTDKERKSLQSLLELARNELKLRYQPQGFHIAFNDGRVFADDEDQHFHIHIIPRYQDQALKLDQRWGIISQ